jgi:hypothetical protein
MEAGSLGGRLVLLESLVKGLLPEADLTSNDEIRQEANSLGIPLPHVDDGESEKIHLKPEDDYALPLMPDQQGQIQYIGPASSFGVHLKFRKLVESYGDVQFVMFGRNAAESDESGEVMPGYSPLDGSNQSGQLCISGDASNASSPSDSVREIDGPVLDSLIDSYFDTINPDFPVLHESSFREAYENWCNNSSATDPSFLCGLLCVLVLARRVTSMSIPTEAERKWWRHIQTLLPTVIFTSNVFAIQALLLTALHMHCTNHRDACWNLTGTATRIAFAIALHRDDIKPAQNPLARELRKQLWWTLYSFEQMQVSSFDRPSAIGQNVFSVNCPNERIIGGNYPQDFMKWSHKLVILLAATCRALNPVGSVNSAMEDAYNRPLSPTATILRDLNKWKDTLPSHLRLEVTDSLAPIAQRQLLLLHAQYHYIIVLILRSALLRRATVLSRSNRDALPQILVTVSETCIESGQSLGRILRRLESIGKYNALTWWDVFLTVNAAVVLGLEAVCHVKQHGSAPSSDSLRELAALSERQLQNPKIPPSQLKWSTIVIEVSSVVSHFTSSTPQPHTANNHHQLPVDATPASNPDLSFSEENTMNEYEPDSFRQNAYSYLTNSVQETSWNAAISLEDSNFARENASHFWAQFSLGDEVHEHLQSWD